ncbi:MAG: hypothetical protein FJW40_08725 [Acidobacteria bacterium]|nr:hypothetical protein [Acidobacteriota bacterium]
MEAEMNNNQDNGAADVRSLVREAIQEFVRAEQSKKEPAYQAELVEERRRREQLERKLNELAEENRRNRQMAEEADRHSAIRAELQRLGVTKVDLAFKAVRDDVRRSESGTLIAGEGVGLRDYLQGFVTENPELLPARIAGGSGMAAAHKPHPAQPEEIDIDKIKPGMSPQDLEKVRLEIARLASQSLRG